MLKNTVSVFILALVLLCSVAALSGCGDAATRSTLDRADSLMEAHPDSALSLLDGIDRNALVTRADRARHSLLLSMALDKNYVDTTTFDILQPAIDYYADHGSADERLRTLYYQGRIYQNRGDLDCAMSCFVRATDDTCGLSDSLTLIRAFVAQGSISYQLYDFESYINCRKYAAELSNKISNKDYEFDCLTNIINGAIILGYGQLADSILGICNDFTSLSEVQANKLLKYRLVYTINFGTKTEIENIISRNESLLQSTTKGNLHRALAYNKLGNYKRAKSIIDTVVKSGTEYDTLKMYAIMQEVLQNIGDYKGSLSVYREYSSMIDSIDYAKFSRQIQDIQEKHKIETNLVEEKRIKQQILRNSTIGIIILTLCVIILIGLLRNKKIKQDLMMQKTINAELENERLENEIERLKTILESMEGMTPDIKTVIRSRIDTLNSILTAYITDFGEGKMKYESLLKKQIENTEEFMNSNREAFGASHPSFIKYLEDHNLSKDEINYVCLYALGLRGKEVGIYINRPGHKNRSIAIRKKLGIEQRSTSLGNYIRHLLKSS